MKRYFYALLLVSIVGLNLATAEDVPGQYIVELTSDPALTVTPKGLRSAAREEAVRSEQMRVRPALESRNVQVLASIGNVMNALIVKADDPAILQNTPGVAHVYPVRLYKKVLDRVAVIHKVTIAGDSIGGVDNAGAGIKVGIIDTGIDSTHPAFRDTGFIAPSGFPKVNKDIDNRYTNNKVIVARNYDTQLGTAAADRDGHGTAVAAIVAGVRSDAPRAVIAGIASKAYLGNYKVFPDGQENAPSSNILKAIDDAVADGMDIINLSLGGFPAGSLDSDPLVQAIENATKAGVLVVVAAGNDGPGLNTISSPATAPSAISVGASSSDRIFAAGASVDGLEPFLAIVAAQSRTVDNVRAAMADVSSLDENGMACATLPPDSLQGKIALIVRGSCFFEEKLNTVQHAGAIAAVVYTDADRPDPITMSVGASTLPAVMIGYFDGLRAKDRLAGGAVDASVDFTIQARSVNPGRLAEFTSKGPSLKGAVKPDLLAVGTSVYTAQPAVDGQPLYAALSGTSFSSPIVAGAAALLKAYRPGLRPDQYKSLLANSAAAFSSDQDTLPIQQTGAGLLDVAAAVRSTIAIFPSAIAFGMGGATVDSTQHFVLQNLGAAADTFAITATALKDVSCPRSYPTQSC